MNLDLVFVLFIVVFVLRGWWRGFIQGVGSTVGFIAGYVFAYLGCREAGAIIARRVPTVPLPLAIGLGGFLIFAGTCTVVSIVTWFVYRRRIRGLTDEAREAYVAMDRDNGATLGLVQGVLLVFFLCTVLALVPAGNPIDTTLGLEESAMVAWARPLAPMLLGHLAATATGSAASAGVVAALVRDPHSAQRAATKVVKSAAIQELVNDPSFLHDVAAGDPGQVARDPRLVSLMQDPEIIEALTELGLSSDDVHVTPEQTAEAIVRVRQLMDDVQRLALQAVESGQLPPGLDTPEIRQAVQNGQVREILGQPGALRSLFGNFAQLQQLTADVYEEGEPR